MSATPVEHFRWSYEGDVALVEVLSRELNQPRLAEEFGAQLHALLRSYPLKNVVLDFHRTKYMSSTAYATLVNFARAAAAENVKLAICGMEPELRVGADIIGLPTFIPIHDDQKTAVASLQAANM